MKLTQRIQSIKPSPTMAITAKAAELRAQGKNIISLSAGEPDFDTPEVVQLAAIDAIKQGQTKYTAVDGIPALKQAIIDKLARDNQLTYQPEQILASCGAKHSIYNALVALLEAGDEAIIPAPYWVSYPDMVKLMDATPVIIDTTIEDDFKITPTQLINAITENTRVLFLNSPSNPSGAAYTREELAVLADVLLQHPHITIISDDIYEHIWWADEAFCNIVNACPTLYDRTLVINGVSKAYAMTGWRIGYTAGNANIIKAMKKVQSQSTSNPCSISQAAAVAALQADLGLLAPMVEAFKLRHDFVIERLNAIEGITCRPAEGAFYAFFCAAPVIEKMGLADDVALAAYLLEQAEIALVPGSAFGSPGYLRMSFATSMESLQEALQRLTQALKVSA